MNNNSNKQITSSKYTAVILALSVGFTLLLSYLALANQTEIRSQLGIVSNKPEVKDWKYYQAQSTAQMAIDSQLVGTTKFIDQGGCNCPYCCARLSLKIYK